MYFDKIENLRKILVGFIHKKVIDSNKLSILDQIVNMAKKDQVRILNSPLSLDNQMILFSAIRNIYNTMDVMREKLITAHNRNENPSTAELSLEIVEASSNLAKYIDHYFEKNEIIEDKIFEFSRLNFKKAKKYGFAKDPLKQLEEVGLTENEINSFVGDLNKNIELEIDPSDEEGVSNEDYHRHISSN